MDMTGVISSQQGSGNYITCEFQKSLAETMTMMFAMDQIDYKQIKPDSSGTGMPGIFACHRTCIGRTDKRNGIIGKRAG